MWFQNRRQRDPTREHKTRIDPPRPARISIDDAVPLLPEPLPAAASTSSQGALTAVLGAPTGPPPVRPHSGTGSSALAKGGRPPQTQGLMWRPMTALPAAPARPPTAATARAEETEPASAIPTSPAPSPAKRRQASGLLMLLSCGAHESTNGGKRQKLA